jgi:hypothetical protein
MINDRVINLRDKKLLRKQTVEIINRPETLTNQFRKQLMNMKNPATLLGLCLMALFCTSFSLRATTVVPAVDCFKQLQEPMTKLVGLTDQIGDPRSEHSFSWGSGEIHALIALLRKLMDGSVCTSDAATINFARLLDAFELKFNKLQETQERKAGGILAHDISVKGTELRAFVMNHLGR